MLEFKILGKIHVDLLESEYGSLQTDDIIITNERLEHIKEQHQIDYALFERYGREVVQEPDIIIKDEKHIATVFMIKRFININLNAVVRLAMGTDSGELKNSVMTFYRIRESNLTKLINKNKVIFKNPIIVIDLQLKNMIYKENVEVEIVLLRAL